MHNRVPLAFRLRHLFSYALVVWAYNLGVSALGAGALLAIRAAGLLENINVGAEAAADQYIGELAAPSAESIRFLLATVALLFATAGHWIGVVVAAAAHRSERELYRMGGWRMAELALGSWAGSALLGVFVLLVVSP